MFDPILLLIVLLRGGTGWFIFRKARAYYRTLGPKEPAPWSLIGSVFGAGWLVFKAAGGLLLLGFLLLARPMMLAMVRSPLPRDIDEETVLRAVEDQGDSVRYELHLRTWRAEQLDLARFSDSLRESVIVGNCPLKDWRTAAQFLGPHDYLYFDAEGVEVGRFRVTLEDCPAVEGEAEGGDRPGEAGGVPKEAEGP